MVNNQKGVTLIELLLAIALLSTVLLLANSLHLFGQKQMTNQTEEIQNQSNVRLAMNIITKEIRKASTANVSNNALIINGTDVYKLDNSCLTKNGQPLVTDLQKIDIKLIDDLITIDIADIPTNNIPQTTLSTTISPRK
jgi:prepilin-type N-terminal cleavage/methylation domain-containing protein